jgi:hypothetical protein
MALMVKSKGGEDFKKVPAGNHVAVCNLVADVGLQPSGYGPKHKVYLRFEIPAERTEYEKDGQRMEGPMTIGSFFTASLSKKATLTGFLESWRGRGFTKEELDGFDLFTVLGASCMLNVIHQASESDATKIYANIKSVGALPKGMAKPKAENPLLKYSPDDTEDFRRLPEWLQKKITDQVSETPEDEGPAPKQADDPGFDDDSVPF